MINTHSSELDLFNPIACNSFKMRFMASVPVKREFRVDQDKVFDWTSSSALREAIAFTGFRIRAYKASGRPYRGNGGEVVATIDGEVVARAGLADCDPYDGERFSLSPILFRALLPDTTPPRHVGTFLPNGSVVSLRFPGLPDAVKSLGLLLDMAAYETNTI